MALSHTHTDSWFITYFQKYSFLLWSLRRGQEGGSISLTLQFWASFLFWLANLELHACVWTGDEFLFLLRCLNWFEKSSVIFLEHKEKSCGFQQLPEDSWSGSLCPSAGRSGSLLASGCKWSVVVARSSMPAVFTSNRKNALLATIQTWEPCYKPQ